jgi:hypothetical protein
MDDHHTNPLAQSADEPVTPQDATEPRSQAPLMHDADTVPLAEFSLTRDQVVELYTAAGIKVEKRTVSRYAQEGLLRAEKVDAERGLKRYLFNRRSVDEDIARRLRGPSSVYAPTNDDSDDHHGATMSEDEASSRHGAATGTRRQASSQHADRGRALEIELATLRGRMIEKDERHAEDVRVINQLRAENGQLRLGIGEYKGRNGELERRLALLEAPKPKQAEPEQAADDAPIPDAPQPEALADATRPGFLRRLFRSR